MGSDNKSTGVMSVELGMSILANATVAVCSTGGLSKEDCAQVLANAARFIGVSTGSFLITNQVNLNQLLSDLENQIISFPGGKMPSYTGSGGENSFILFINGDGPEASLYKITVNKKSDCYKGYIDEDGKAYLYDNSVLLKELGISEADGKDLSLQEIMQLAPEAAQYMSWWREKDKSYTMTLNTYMEDMPIKVIRRNHDVTIDINTQFTDENGNILTEGKRVDLARAGIKMWEGTFYDTVEQKGFLSNNKEIIYDDFGYNEIKGQPGYVNVKVNINEQKAGASKKYVSVKLSDNVSNNNTIECSFDGSNNPHAMFPFGSGTAHIQMYDKDIRGSGPKYSDTRYKEVIGHETGHILGIGDGYADEKKQRGEPANSKEIPNNNLLGQLFNYVFTGSDNDTDIMIDGSKVTSNDIEMILAAWQYHHKQDFGLYKESNRDNRKSPVIKSY